MPHAWTRRIADYLYAEPRFRPNTELRLLINQQPLGWIQPAAAHALLRLAPGSGRLHGSEVQLILREGDYASRSRRLQALAEALRAEGLVPGWRGEPMTLHDADGLPWAEMERAVFRTWGLRTHSVHLNAFVQTPGGAEMWIARRSALKAVDPGLLDNLVGGGIIGAEGIGLTLQREAWEEAGLRIERLPSLQNSLRVLRHCAHGVQDEVVHVHDLWIRSQFSPENQDGEVASTQRLPLPLVAEQLLGGRFTRDAGLVILDGLCRLRFFAEETSAITSALRDYGIYG